MGKGLGNKLLGLRKVCLAGLALALGLPQAASAQDVPASLPPPAAEHAHGQQVFEPAFFTRFAPRNAFDMLAQLPGFSLKEGDGARGLGQVSTNVLINGQRLAGKSEDTFTQLSRIPAGNVVRIELVDAATLDLPGLSGQVANIVAKAGGLTGQFSWVSEARAHFTDPLWTRAEVSLSGKSGSIEYTLGLANQAWRCGAGGPSTISDASGTVIETRSDVLLCQGDNPKLSAAVKLDGPGSSIGNLSGFFRKESERYTVVELRRRVGQAERTRLLAGSEGGHEWELGGDFEFPLGPGRLKLIGLATGEADPAIDQSQIGPTGGAATGGDRFEQDSRSSERIVRSEYSWQMLGADWQLSGEAAFNRLDVESRLFTLSPAGDFVAQPFPEGTGGVRETRYESILSYSRAITPHLSLQVAGGAEYSRLSQTGANAVARAFWRPKGSFNLAWTPQPGLDLSFKANRRVGQLDFGDFLARVFIDDDNANAGNADLVPPQSWEFEVEAKKSLGAWGTTTLRLFDHRIEDLVDFIPIGTSGESLGNIDRARRQGLEWTTTLKFDPLGIPGLKLDAGVELKRSRLKDPLTGEMRPISETNTREVQIELRYDIPRSNWAAGFNLSNFAFTPYYRLGEIGIGWEGPTFAGVFVENKDVFGLTVQFRAGNLLNARNRFDRTVHTGFRDRTPVAFVESRNRLIGPIFKLTVKGGF